MNQPDEPTSHRVTPGERSVRILHVLTTPRAEGTPNLVLDWLSAGTSHVQSVLVLNSQPADLTERLRAAAHGYWEHDLFARGRRKFPLIAAAARAATRAFRPDLVVCWPTGFAGWVGAGVRAGGCRRLVVHAGNPANRGRRADWIARYVMWPLAAMGGRVVCCSHYVRDSLAAIPGVSAGLLHVVYNCTRTADVARRAAAARANRPAGNGPVAVMVATLERHKDHDTLLAAVPAIRAQFPAFKLRLAGDGSRRRELEAQVERAALGDAVEFLGTRSDVPELLGAADLFVLATTPQEGLGSVLLEAMAARTPIVASDVPACRETLAGGRWGVLAPAGDPHALADAIVDRLTAPPSADALTEAADYAAGFTPQAMLEAYLQIAGIAAPLGALTATGRRVE